MASSQTLKLPIYPSSSSSPIPRRRRLAVAIRPITPSSPASPPISSSSSSPISTSVTKTNTVTVTSPNGSIPHPLRVAYQGAPGAYSEFAASTAVPISTPIPCRTFSDTVTSVIRGHADLAILPVESTLEGTALRNYELLLQHNLVIVQEISLFVHYCLLALPGVRTPDLRKVISHPMALAHCDRAIADLGLQREPVNDTAGAVEMLRRNNFMDTAAIASPRAAEIYGLQVLMHGLQDESWNVTRFLLLAPQEKARHISFGNTNANVKTSMVVAHRGGSMMVLLKVLSVFSERNINLTKLEVNNPTMEGGKGPVMVMDVGGGGCLRAFPHVLYVDFEGSTEEEKVKEAIEEIAGFSVMVRVLGSYAADTKIYDLY